MSCKPCESFDINEAVSIVPSIEAIRMVQGTDATFEFVLTNGDDEVVDLTADDVVLTVRDEKGGTVQLQKTNEPGDHIEPTQGRTSFDLAHSDFAAELSDEHAFWVYEVRRIRASGKEAVHIEGAFILDKAVGGLP